MLIVHQVKCRVSHSNEDVVAALCKKCHIKKDQIAHMEILRRSLDARKKPDLFYLYTVLLELRSGEAAVLKACAKDRDVQQTSDPGFRSSVFPEIRTSKPSGKRPVIIGSGPAGLFCAWELTMAGLNPIVLERGKKIEERTADVEKFWKDGILDPSSNVQFGEGGAGTFSDGKLNTLVKDTDGRNRKVLKIFVSYGAEESILYDQKPHLGTDVLKKLITDIRLDLEKKGAEFRFGAKATDLVLEKDAVRGVIVNDTEQIDCDQVILAVGHSARDTFLMLDQKGIAMEQKPFAVGYRVIHPQEFIDKKQYGTADRSLLGAAAYKVTGTGDAGHGVYSFCMCPGGYVVNASSEEEGLAVNGMSYSGRSGSCANSAMIVTVTPKEYTSYIEAFDEKSVTKRFLEEIGDREPLKGVVFQRMLEYRAYHAAGGKIPIRKYGDFRKDFEKRGMIEHVSRETTLFDAFTPGIKGQFAESSLENCMPEILQTEFITGMEQIGRKMRGFADDNIWLCGIESRTSSPIRIRRGADLVSDTVKGLYPCGEGAGYAGGITSAAADGIKVADKILEEWDK